MDKSDKEISQKPVSALNNLAVGCTFEQLETDLPKETERLETDMGLLDRSENIPPGSGSIDFNLTDRSLREERAVDSGPERIGQ